MQRAEYWRRMAGASDREAEFVAVCRDAEKEVARCKIEIVDMLQELAQAHGLVRTLGQDRVQEMMAMAFGWQPITTR